MQIPTKKISIWWIRRDLRLIDNQALQTALNHADLVVPLFVLDQNLLKSNYVSEKRLAFLWDGLRNLDSMLRDRGSYLVVRSGKPGNILHELTAETKANAIFAEEDYSPYARKRDNNISKSLPLNLEPGLTLHHPKTIQKKDGNPYIVFSPFSKAWKNLSKSGMYNRFAYPEKIPSPENISSEIIPEYPVLPGEVPYIAGEEEAQERIHHFTQGENPGVYRYDEMRNRPDLDSTSRLSPYLRFGMISPRQTIATAFRVIATAPNIRAKNNAEIWLNELIWREFFQSILFHFPHVRRTSFQSKMRNIRWVNNPDDFAAWCAGKTGYPFIDAAMRQLLETGWMHNRPRMITASFLTKDLLINWQKGETWFMQNLIDGDPAANNGGWQWVAGTGTDAAPYFRIFNPVLQSKKFDPEGNYIKRWVPELTLVSARYIHTPWKMPIDEQKRANCRIGENYPAPIIDHAWARERALSIYKQAKDNYE